MSFTELGDVDPGQLVLGADGEGPRGLPNPWSRGHSGRLRHRKGRIPRQALEQRATIGVSVRLNHSSVRAR